MSRILEQHREALASDPENKAAFEALQEHLFIEGEWEQLVALYRRRLEAPSLKTNSKQRVPLLFRLAQVLDERCGESEQALKAYWEVARADPQFRPALRQLRHIYSSRGQWDLVLQTAELEGQARMDPLERALFLAELGEVWLQRLDDAAEARGCFERALEADPHQQKALEGLARVHELGGRAREAAVTWERLVDVLRGPERAPALVSLGRLLAGPLKQTERASACFRRAMTDDPRDLDAVEALLAIATSAGQWALLSDLYERRFDLASGARQRAAIAVEAGSMLLSRLRDRAAARRWFERALQLVDDDASVHNSLADLAREEGDHAALQRSLDRVIELAGSSAPLGVLVEAAELHSEQSDDATAVAYLQEAQRRKPEDPLILGALSDALARTGRSGDLVEVLEQRAALRGDDVEAQTEALLELSRLYEDELGDSEAALGALARAFDVNPQASGVARRLMRLYRKTERWSELRQMLERARGQGSSTERCGYACELGMLLLDHCSDPGAATRAFEAALELDPSAAPALQGLLRIARESGDDDALLRICAGQAETTSDPERMTELASESVRLLEAKGESEQALEWAAKWLTARPDDRAGLETMARLQRELERFEDLCATLTRLDPLLEGTAQAENRHQLADLQLQQRRPDQAMASLEAALESDPEDVVALQRLRTQYEASHRLQDLVRVLRRLGELLPTAESARCLDQLAVVLDEQLGEVDSAIVVMWRLCGMRERPAGASERLERLLERAGRFEELAQQLLERRRSLPEESDEAEQLDLRRAALLMDKLGQLEQAASLYRTIRSRNPRCREATEGLEHALRSGNDSAGLVLLLESKARNESDAGTRCQIEFERAVILEEALADQEAAQTIYAALADRAEEPAVAALAAVRIERVLERRGDWHGLRQRLDAGLGRGSEQDDFVLHERLAVLCRDRLEDLEQGVRHLEAMGELQPGRAETWRDLALLYHELGSKGELLRVMQSELACGPDAVRELLLRTRCAHLYREKALRDEPFAVESTASARSHYERVLELEPTHSEASEFLIEHYEAEDRPADIARLLSIRIEHGACQPGEPGEECTALRVRLGRLLAERLDDLDGAISVLEAAVSQVGPENVVAEPLAELYGRRGGGDALIELCRRAARTCEAPAERAVWLVRQGDALRASGQLQPAAEAWCAALLDRPGDREIEAALRDVYRRLGDASSLAALIESEIPRAAPAERIPLRLELAGLLADSLGRSEEALAQLQQVLAVEGDNADAFNRAMVLGEGLERPGVILELLDARLAAATVAAERAELLERRGHHLVTHLDRPEEAASAFREAVALQPDRHSARQALRSLMERLQRWPAVLDCLHMEAQASGPDEREAILKRAVEIAQQHLSGDAVLPWLERLRAERPDDPAVIARMADVHRRAGRPEALLRCLELELSLVEDAGRRRDLHVDGARILERDLHAPGRAIHAYETARALAPRDAMILRELDRLYDLMGRVRERVEVLETLIDVTPAEQRIDLHRKTALLLAASLAEPTRAIPHLLCAVSLCRAGADVASQIQLLRELAENLRAAGRIDAWVRCAEAELEVLRLDDGAQRLRACELHHELASVCGGELGLPDAAVRHLRATLQLDEQSQHAGTETLPSEHHARAELDLIARLRASRSHRELADRIAGRLDRGLGDSAEWLELARLRSEQLHAPSAAAEAYREVLARQPGSLAAIRGLRHESECLRDWSEVAHCLELELELPDRHSPPELLALQSRLGDVCWRRLQATARAAQAYRAGLAAVPGDLDALRSLQMLLEQSGQPAEAMALFEREVELLGEQEPERRRQVWLRIAQIARGQGAAQLGERARARALHAFEQAAAISALEPPDQRAWAELYRAAGNLERYCETFALWCDHPHAAASGWDHLALVAALQQLGRSDAALERAAAASAVDPDNVEVWDALASSHEKCGDATAACAALERAAALHPRRLAAERLVRAAALCEPNDRERSAALLCRACEADPGLARAHAELARVGERLGRLAEAETAAGRALDLAVAGEGLDRETRLRTALCGGRVAHAQDRLEQAARFFAAALELDAEHIEALDAQGEVLFERGEFRAARRVLEGRLELSGENPQRARQLAIVARGLEHEAEESAALARYREALEADPALALAHEGVVRIHEAAGDARRAVSALESWIAVDDDAESRAQSRLRAAEHCLAEGRLDSAEAQLRDAVADDCGEQKSWVLLTEMLHQLERSDEALDQADHALEHLDDRSFRARVSLVRGRILDARGEGRRAIEAYREAASGDPRNVEAALAQARLLRSIGDWYGSAEALQRFAENHPDPESLELAQVHLECGRLLAGPLEDVDGAIRCYERTLALEPELAEAREPLASLLAHVPERWRDAVANHRELLAAEPARPASLRALLEISRRREIEPATRFGLAVLRALGRASPGEAELASGCLPRKLDVPEQLEDPVWETARRICGIAAQEISQALSQRDLEAEPVLGSAAVAQFMERLSEAESELTAPGLCALPSEALSSLVYTVTALAADLGGNCQDGPYLHLLDHTLGRWARRKIRKTLGPVTVREIQAIDYDGWRNQIRVIAACRTLDSGDGDLRSALIGLTCAAAKAAGTSDRALPEPSESADIGSLLAGSQPAQSLLARVDAIWCSVIMGED